MQRRGANRQPAKGQRAKRPKGGPKAARKASPAHSSIEHPQEQLVERLRRERDEAIEFQTATGEVLRIVASSPDDLQRVFDAMLEKAISLCAAKFGSLFLYDGKGFTVAADRNLPPEYAGVVRGQFFTPEANTGLRRLVESKMPLHVTDTFDASYAKGEPLRMAAVELGGVRSLIAVPLLKNGELIGNFSIYKEEPGGFAENQIALVTTFTDQAVIAIQNARLFEQTKEALRKLEARSSELAESLQHQTATSQILSVISSSRADIQPVFDAIVNSAARLFEPCGATITTLKDGQLHWDATAATLPDFDIERAKAIYPISFDPERAPSARALLERRIIEIPDIAAPDTPEFTRKAAAAGGFRSVTFVPLIKQDKGIGTIILTHQRAGFKLSEKQLALVRTFADQAVIAIENVRLLNELRQRTDDLTQSLDDLRTAQDRLVQTEKLASLGQLTAGIAHEIKNPLNFVNNFSALSAELIDELDETLAPATLDQKVRREVGELTEMLKSNLEKVVQHGKRADSIVKNMLLHSREGSGEQRPAEINALLDESLSLAYHGARAEKPGFNITLRRDFDPSAGVIELFPQEITRAFLNLISNGFYAASVRKAENGDPDFEPALSAATKNLGSHVEIRIRDNGTGIPLDVREKIFNPFFTTKPAGEGTGLGLSMSHDIIVKQHGGTIDVETEPGQFTEFTIVLPRTSNSPNRNRGQP